jgi:hypothetical protein
LMVSAEKKPRPFTHEFARVRIVTFEGRTPEIEKWRLGAVTGPMRRSKNRFRRPVRPSSSNKFT